MNLHEFFALKEVKEGKSLIFVPDWVEKFCDDKGQQLSFKAHFLLSSILILTKNSNSKELVISYEDLIEHSRIRVGQEQTRRYLKQLKSTGIINYSSQSRYGGYKKDLVITIDFKRFNSLLSSRPKKSHLQLIHSNNTSIKRS